MEQLLKELQVVDEYNLRNPIKMIIADTSDSTGKKGGVVVKLKEMLSAKSMFKAQSIGFQHHVMDKIFRLVMEEELSANTGSPNPEYPFVSRLVNNYEEVGRV